MHHGGLLMAVLHGRSPSPYTSVTGNLNLLQKNWSKSMVHSPDLSEDTLKRCITTIPPSITTTHHDGGLPSPLFYTLANDTPPPSLYAYSMLEAKIKGQAPILKWRVDKTGGCTACRQIESKTRDGEGWLRVLEEIRGTIQKKIMDSFYLIWMKMTKTKLAETLG